MTEPTSPQEATTAAGIVFDGVRHRYGNELALRLDDLTLRGNTVLVGHNGAGKSTLLQLAAGLLVPTKGVITVNGHPAGSPAARQAVSFVPDQPALFDDLTLANQMTYVARLHGLKTVIESAQNLIEVLDAFDLLDRVPGSMSKGQRQKASVLVAMARPWSILLTDEPTTGLDADSRTALVRAFQRLTDDGLTIISSTHDTELIEMSTEQVELSGGRLVGEDREPSDDQ